ncbi:MAG: hypothetical protein LBU65_06280 [Planctomycetaceae bacterium]|jgi:hypothetical protein|nr:hypothetical protein [Planctomycetaceae bacterium]
MIIGNPEVFAIDYIIKDVEVNKDDNKEWIHGQLLIHINNYVVGDAGRWVNFKDCIYWMEDMIKRQIHIPTERYSHISAKDLVKIFRTKSIVDLEDCHYNLDDAIDSVQSMPRDDFCEGLELYQSTCIVAIGERSLDDVIILMIDQQQGFKRFVIQQHKGEVYEFVVKTEVVIETIREFIDSYRKEVKTFPVHYFVV